MTVSNGAKLPSHSSTTITTNTSLRARDSAGSGRLSDAGAYSKTSAVRWQDDPRNLCPVHNPDAAKRLSTSPAPTEASADRPIAVIDTEEEAPIEDETQEEEQERKAEERRREFQRQRCAYTERIPISLPSKEPKRAAPILRNSILAFTRPSNPSGVIAIGNTIFKGTTVKSSIAELRWIRPDVAIADVSGEMNGFPTLPPAGVPDGADGVLRFKLLMVLIKEHGIWWITESQRRRHA
jgi:hypothetical protein